MSTQIVKDGTTDGSKDSFGSGTESSQEFGFINIFCLGLPLFNSDQVKFLSHTTHYLTSNDPAQSILIFFYCNLGIRVCQPVASHRS